MVLRIGALERDGVTAAAAEIARLASEDDGVSTVVVGVPRHLDGSASDMTARVKAFAAALERITRLPLVLQDERLTSREAESRLALTDKDWRSRKERLDAAAAAIILQDYLDVRSGHPTAIVVGPDA